MKPDVAPHRRWNILIGASLVLVCLAGLVLATYGDSTLAYSFLVVGGLGIAVATSLAVQQLVKLKIAYRGLALISLPLVFVLGFVLLIARIEQTNARAQQCHSDSRHVIAQAQLLWTTLVEAESATSGYIINGDRALADQYQQTIARTSEATRTLKQLVADNQEQLACVIRLEQAAAEKMKSMADLQRLMREGRGDSAMDLAKLGGGHTMDRLRDEVSLFVRTEQELNRELQRGLNESWQRLRGLLLGAAVGGGLLTLLLALLFNRGISGRLSVLTENARRLAAGRPLAQPVRGADEIARLDRVFHDMAATLEEAARKERALIENAPAIICSVDIAGRFAKVNAGSLKLLGYAPEELVGRLCFDFIDPPDLERASLTLGQVVAGEDVRDFEITFRHKDSSLVHLSWASSWIETEKLVFGIGHDVSERKRTNESLSASEARLAGILSIAEDAVISVDETHRVTMFNQGAERIFGYTSREVLGQPLDLLLPDRFKQTHQEHIVEFSKSGDVSRKMGKRREVYGRRKDGSEFPSEASISSFSQGDEITFTVMLRDITAQKKAHDALLASEARFAGILSIAEDAVISVDETHRITMFNQSAERVFGYTSQEMLGQPLNLLLPDRFKQTHQEHIVEFSKSGDVSRKMGKRREVYGRRKDGSEFPSEASISRLALGDETTFTVMLRDVTAQKKAHEALLASEARFAGILSVAEDAVISIDEDHRITMFNQGAERIFGYAPREALGQPLELLIPDRFREMHRQHVIGFGQSGNVSRTMGERSEVYGRRKDGSEFPGEASISKLQLGEEKVFTVMLRDVSLRRRTEDEIGTLNETLKHNADRLADANRELEAFSYSVSHDLRAPLRHIHGFADLLQKHSASSLDETGLRYVSTIRDAAKRLGRLVDDLLAFSRLTRTEMRTDVVDLDQLAREVTTEAALEAGDRDIAWAVDRLPTVQGEPAMLRLVFVNLVSNAVKYTSTRSHARIEIGSDGRLDETVFFVRDNGVGFDMRYADKLFGVFQRLHRADEFEGTGIGLANVQRIIRRHGGRTWAEGVVDEGATFYFTLPLKNGNRASEVNA